MTATAQNFSQISNAFANLAEATAPLIVEVQSHRSLASGFIWRDGLVITPDETLAEEGTIQIELSDGTVKAATLIGRDPATDVALLRADDVKAKPFEPAGNGPRPGSLALVVAAAESAPLIASGVVAAIGPAWQSMRGGAIDARIELDGMLRSRAEGGLAVGGDGTALGMAVPGPRGRTMVIPMSTIDRVARQLRDHGKVAVAYLGAGFQAVPHEECGSAIMVMSVDRDGPAAVSGLLQGDIVMSWASKRVEHVGGLLRMLRATPVGTAVRLNILRGGVAQEVTVTIGDRPQR